MTRWLRLKWLGMSWFVYSGLIFSILFSASSHAEEISPDLIRGFNDALCETNNLGQTTPNYGVSECASCHGASQDPRSFYPEAADYRKCAEKICGNGPIPSINEMSARASRRAAANKGSLRSQINRKLQELAELELSQFKAKSEFARSRIMGKPPGTDGTDEEFRAHNLNIVRDFYPHVVFRTNRDGTRVVDETATRIRLRGMLVREVQADYLINIYNIYAAADRQPSYTSELGGRDPSFYASRYQTPFSRGRLVAMVQDSIRTIEQRGDAASVAFYKNQVEKMPAAVNMSENQVLELMRIRLAVEDRAFELSNSALREELRNKEMAARANLPFSTAEQMQSNDGIRRLLGFINDSSAQEKAKRKFVDDCTDRLALHLESLPSDQQLRQFATDKNNIVNNFAAKAMAPMSGSSRSSLTPGFKASAKFLLPPSREGFVQNFNRRLENIKQGTLSPESPEWGQRVNGGQLARFLTNFNSEDAFAELTSKACSFPTRFHVADNEFTAKGAISLNGPTLSNPALYRGIINHELGHALAKTISDNGQTSQETKSWMDNTKACLSGQHKAAKRGGTGFLDWVNPLEAAGDSLSNEDFADLMAGLAGRSGENYACNMVDTNPASAFPFSLESPDASTHSTGFFRLLHMQSINRGQIPESCQEALRSNDEGDRNFKNCADPKNHGTDGDSNDQ